MILMYHKVDIVAPTRWWVSTSKFADHMEALKRLDLVYLDQYDPGEKSQCVITFDDCYENIYRHAFPILKDYGYPFEIFMIGNFCGAWNKFDMSKEPATRFCNLTQLQDMAKNGARIQWHTSTHNDLSSVPLKAAREQMVVPEILKTKYFTAPHLSWFSYPYGARTPQVVDVARNYFRGAVAVEDGIDSDRYQLQRIVADEDLNMSALVDELCKKTKRPISWFGFLSWGTIRNRCRRLVRSFKFGLRKLKGSLSR